MKDQPITANQKSYLIWLLNQHDLMDDRAGLIEELTGGAKSSLRALSKAEAADCIRALAGPRARSMEQMRKKMISLAIDMDWGTSAKDVLPKIDRWSRRYSPAKCALKDHSYESLVAALTAFEKTYQSFLASLNPPVTDEDLPI
jgi:hypothetical protein